MTTSRPSIHEYYLNMLELVASRSTCSRRKVGAIITDYRGVQLGAGYNGVPRGFPHCIDTPCDGATDQAGDTSRCMAIHAEANAILQCTDISKATTIYCSSTPCFQCAKLIANTGIRNVFCKEPYADKRGLEIFEKAGINVYHGNR